MAAIPVVINNAVIIDYYDRVIGGPYKVVGNLARSDVGIGGGPIIPPSGEKPPGVPPGIWPGPGDPDFPGGGKPPGGGLPGAHPEHPIVIPLPPNTPNVPPPGSPPVIVSGTTPTHPIVPPSAIIIDYPGIGKVVVPQPTQTTSGAIPGA